MDRPGEHEGPQGPLAGPSAPGAALACEHGVGVPSSRPSAAGAWRQRDEEKNQQDQRTDGDERDYPATLPSERGWFSHGVP